MKKNSLDKINESVESPKLILDEFLNKEVEDKVLANLISHNYTVIGPYKRQKFSIYIRDKDEFIAGLIGYIRGNQSVIELLQVNENYRNKSLGTKLISRAEEYSLSQGCITMQVDTIEFQARGFYEKLDFKLVATIPGGFIGYDLYVLRKEL